MPARPVPFSISVKGALLRLATLGLGASLALGTCLEAGAKGLAGPQAAEGGNLDDLDQACLAAVAKGDTHTVELLQERLLTIKPVPQPLAVVLANAEVLLNCQAPDLALQVLARFSPAPGAERNLWLAVQWRAAVAGLNHALAAQALQQLAAGPLASLELRQLRLKQKDDGTWVTRSALDLLATHLESLGRDREAAELLLAGRQGGPLGAERIALAVGLLERLPMAERQRLLELALEQAAAAGTWGLVAQLLDQQLDLEAKIAVGVETAASRSLAMQRRLKLSGRIDDAYGEWQVRRGRALAQDRARLAELELQLRSPRAAGGQPALSWPVMSQP